MGEVSWREEQEKFLLEIQDKGLSPVIALLSSMRTELSRMRTKCLEADSRYDHKIFELCLAETSPKLTEAIEKLKKLQGRIEQEIK